MNRKHRTGFFVVLVVILLANLGCSMADAFPIHQVTALPGTARPTSPRIPTTPTTTPTAVLSASSEPLTLGDITANMEGLESFRSEFSIKSEGIEKATSKPYVSELSLLQEVNKAKKAEHFRMDGSGYSSIPYDAIDMYVIDQQGHVIMNVPGSTAPTCISFNSQKPTFDTHALFSLEHMLGSIQSGNLVAHEERVNGVLTDHYRLDRMVLGFGTAAAVSGEVWFAHEGGYVVRFYGQAEGEFNITTPFTGKVTWTYELTQINQVTAIEPPAMCAAQPISEDFPVPANVTQKIIIGDMISFDTLDGVTVVSEWYNAQARAQGWAVQTVSASESLVVLTLTRQANSYAVMISARSGKPGSAVVVTGKR